MRCAVYGPPESAQALLLVAATALAGCGGGQADALQQNVSRLREEVTLLHNAVDVLEERLAAAEARSDAEARDQAVRSRSPAAGTLERPRLKVVRVQPEAQSQVEPSARVQAEPAPAPFGDDSSGPRPTIRGTGDRIETEFLVEPASASDCADQTARENAKTGAHNSERCRRPGSRPK